MFIIAGLRALQILFSIIILGLSVSLIKGQGIFNPPSQTSYASFCGGWGLLIAFVGIVALFVESLQGIIIAALDGITTVLVLAGGITLAATLGIHTCSDSDYVQTNVITCGGCGEFQDENGNLEWGYYANDPTGRCHQAQATTAFLFFSFACFIGAATLGMMKKSGNSRSIV